MQTNKGKKYSNSKNPALQRMKYEARKRKAFQFVCPTYPNMYETTALIPSDFTGHLCKQLAPFNSVGNQVFLWRSQYDAGTLAQSGTVEVTAAYAFTLAQCVGYSDLTAAFDQYRLRAVTVTFSPQNQMTNQMGNPRLYTVIDYDDVSAAGRSTLQQYDTCIVTPPNAGVTRALVPRMAVAAYSGAFTSYANTVPQWIDAASTGVYHYGVKAAIEAGSMSQTNLQVYDVNVVVCWEFRATR